MADSEVGDLGNERTTPTADDWLYCQNAAKDTDYKMAAAALSLELTAEKTATTYSAAKGELVICNVDTNDIEITPPGTPAKGDWFGYVISQQDGSIAYNADLTGGPTVVNNDSYTGAAAGKWSCWLDGEILIFQYVDATTGWIVRHDGRIPHRFSAVLETDQTGIVAATYTKIEYDVIDQDPASMWDAGNHRLTISRTNTHIVMMTTAHEGVADAKILRCKITDDSTGTYISGPRNISNTTSEQGSIIPPSYVEFTAGDVVAGEGYCQEGTQGAGTDSTFGGTNVLRKTLLDLYEVL